MSAVPDMHVPRHHKNQTGTRRLSWAGRRHGIVVAAAALVGALAAAGPAAAAQSTGRPSSPSPLMRVSAAPRLPAGAHVIGPVRAHAQLSGGVALRLRSQARVTAFIDGLSNPRSAHYHGYLTKGQFARRFGPTKSAVAAVRAQLREDGLVVTHVSTNKLLVSFRGSAAKVEAAFHTGLVRVALANGRAGQATTSAVRLPSSVGRYVSAVVGLDRLVTEKTGPILARKGHGPVKPAKKMGVTAPGPVACSAAASQQEFGALTDQQVANSYGLGPLYAAGDVASGQTVDIYELEPFAVSDVKVFDKCYFGADHTSQISVTSVDGGPGTGPGSGEAALDVDDVSALAPGADIHVFSGPNMGDPFGPLDTWNAIAVADDARQISTSWGLCETEVQQGAPGVQQVENEIFEQTAAQGQSVFSSAGDDGSDDCANHGSSPVATNLSVDDPSSQPYVTSVGGTTITNASEPPVESVWNNGDDGGATGGGISETWQMPAWQSGLAVGQTAATQACSNDPSGTADNYHLQGIPTNLTAGTSCRELPDISALADPQTGITIVYGGQWFQIGGTSSSTPLWAAMLAEINASTGCNSLPDGVGFVSPLLYQVAASSAINYSWAFSDVTLGNNDNLGVGGAVDYPAGTGYDMATGLGTPRVTDADGSPGLAAQLCTAASGGDTPANPQVSGLTKTSGSRTGGGTLTVNGSNFGASQGSVFFGNVIAAVTNWTPTAITITIPAFDAPPGTPAGVAGSADVTVVTGGSQPESSSPSSASVYHYTADASGDPVVDYVSSSNGPTTGGNKVDIVGAGLTGATAVHFGDVAATGVSVLSDNEVSATVPATDNVCATSVSQGMCAVAVTVTTPAGISTGPTILPAYQGPLVFQPNGAFVAPAGCGCEIVPAPQEYDYAKAPSITSVTPEFSSENGGTVAQITGTGFNLLTFEWYNVGPAGPGFDQNFSITGVTPTELDVVIPPAAPSTNSTTAPLSVLSAGQLSNVSSVTYAGTPKLTSISKHLAAQADPGTLTITGTGLSDVSSVVFAGQGFAAGISSTSTLITNQSNTSLKVAIPQFFNVSTDVQVCSVTGCSAADPAKDTLIYAYAGRPILSSSSPVSGPAHGDTVVTIQGVLDSDVTAVDFGSQPAPILSEVEFSASGPLIVLAPPGTAGKKVDITITTLGGTLVGQPRSAVNTKVTYTYKASSPAAPGDLVVKAGVKSASASWKAPADNGGSKVTGYVITAMAKGHKSVTLKLGLVTKATIHGLAPKVAWTISVQAVNKLGRGVPAASTVTPR
jgi:Pro-kumamolisin, activation domain/Fibronectin type III domain/IPT/TIG domain